MKVEVASFSEVGPRDSNQDRVLVPEIVEASVITAAIADGIGGAPGGAEAAEAAISGARAISSPEQMAEIFAQAVRNLQRKSNDEPGFERMGTTLSVAILNGETAYIGHVGDTRIYHIRGAGLVTLTEDQTEVAELRRKGILTENQARRYPRRNVLTSALTVEGDYELFEKRAQLQVGDRLLLISDGVYQRMSRGKILNISVTEPDLHTFIENLRSATAAANPSDNFSAIGMEVLTL